MFKSQFDVKYAQLREEKRGEQFLLSYKDFF